MVVPIAENERMPNRAVCAKCGSSVGLYLCNGVMPEHKDKHGDPFIEWDYAAFCDNRACENHVGECYFQDFPDWAIIF